MINPLIISRLLEDNISIFLPIDGEKTFVVADKKTSELKRCVALNASRDGDGTPFIKVDKINLAIACVDKTTRTVWFLPANCYRPNKVLRLGKNYERYIIPEPNSLSYREQKEMRRDCVPSLIEIARKAGERMHKGDNCGKEN